MAYLAYNPNDPNQNQNQQQQNGPVTLNGSGSANSNGGQGSNSAQPQNTQTPGQNGFGDIQAAISKNQNAPNSAGQVLDQTNQAVQQNQQQSQQIGSQLQQPEQFQMEAGKADVNKLADTVKAEYKGPKAGSINTQPQNWGQMSQQASALGSMGGQQALLARQNQRPDYSQGEQRFDTLLQGRNGQFQQQSAQAQNQARFLQNQQAVQNEAFNRQAGASEAQVAANKQAALKYGNDESANTQKELDEKAKKFNDEESAIANGTDYSGLDLGAAKDQYTNEGLKKFVHYTPGMMANQSNIDPEKAQYFNAIQQAIGGTGKIDPASQAAQHGKYTLDQQALEQQNKAFEAERQQALDAYKQRGHNIYQNALNYRGGDLGDAGQNAFTGDENTDAANLAKYQAVANNANPFQSGQAQQARDYIQSFKDLQNQIGSTKSKYGRK